MITPLVRVRPRVQSSAAAPLKILCAQRVSDDVPATQSQERCRITYRERTANISEGCGDGEGTGEAVCSARVPQRVAICVCTCKRPAMLASCLASLSAQSVGENLEVCIVVIDNEAEPVSRPAVEHFAAACPFSVRYVHEPRRGIASARNAALDTATAIDADWIAFIDDDETASPDWVANLMAPEYLGTPILAGLSLPVYPAKPSFWCSPSTKAPKAADEGKQRKTATTNNVRFSMELVRTGIRFNDGLKLAGGEDQEFFSAAHKAGFKIRKTLKAVAYEKLHPERLTYWGQVSRAYWCAASDVRRDALLKGWNRTILRKTHKVPFGVLFGMVEIVASPLFLAAGLSMFKRRAVAGGKKIARAIGRAVGLCGHCPQPYAVIHGS